MAITTTGDVAAFLPNYYTKVFLERLMPGPVLSDYAMQKPLPSGNGKTVYFPRMVVSSTQVSAYKLTEGTVVTPEKIDDVQISAVIEQFGNAKAISDLTELTAIDATTEETVRELGDQAKNILDKRIRDEAYGTSASPWGGGFSIQFADIVAGSGTYLNVSAAAALLGTSRAITAAYVRQWAKILKGRNVAPLEDGFYGLVVHSDTAMTLQADSAWQTAYQYTDPENIRKGVVGSYAGVKIQVDNNILVSAAGSSSASLYYSILLGRGAMGVTTLDGGVKTFTEKSGGNQDPLHQFMTFGWKANMVPVRLNVSCGLICVSSDQ